MSSPKHYQNFYERKLTPAEKKAGVVKIKLDPYRVCKELNVGGGPREQIVKKGLRWTSKNQTERQVLTEIMQACQRGIEMLDEDGVS